MIRPFALGRLPHIEFGAGRFETVPDAVARHGRRVVLVASPSFAGSPRRAGLADRLRDAGTELLGEVRVHGEPSPELVDDAVAEHRLWRIDVVLGIGGGSVLDTAKAIAGLLRTGTSARDHLEGVGDMPYGGPALPWMAVPTTAGTGSEVTRNAVLSEPGHFKRSFRDERLVAAEAIVDPDLLEGLPRPRIASGGMDAVTQLVEPYVSSRATPVTDALALDGLAAARDGLIAWHGDPEGPGAPDARSRMAYAALLSGVCLANAGLGAIHGLAASLGGAFPVPHGAACGALAAATVEVNVIALRERGADSPALPRYAVVGRLLTGLPAETTDDHACDALVDLLRAWASRLGIARLSTFGISEADLPRLVADARGSSMRTNPVTLTDAELTAILSASL